MKKTSLFRKLTTLLATACAVFLVVTPTNANAAVNTVSVGLSDPTPSATGVTYTWTWSGYLTTASTKCVRIEMDTAADGSGTLPTGMSLATTTLAGTYGGTWTRDATSVATGIVVFNWTTGVTPSAGPTTFTLGAVTNSTTALGATYFMLLSTYDTIGAGSGACAGAIRDAQTSAAFETTPGITASVTIDPSLNLTVSSVAASASCGDATTTILSTASAVNLGHIAATTSHPIGAQSLNVTTNAGNGYTVYISYSGPMTGASTSRAFVNHTGTNGTPTVWVANGTEAFGYTTESAALAGTAGRFHTNKWAALSTTGSELMHNSATPAAIGDTNCIAFQASEAGNTPADVYSTTVRYNAVGVF